MPYPGETFVNSFGSALSIVATELRQYYALMQGFLSTEHRDDGTHGNITAQSATVTGNVQIDGNLGVTGTTTLRNGATVSSSSPSVVNVLDVQSSSIGQNVARMTGLHGGIEIFRDVTLTTTGNVLSFLWDLSAAQVRWTAQVASLVYQWEDNGASVLFKVSSSGIFERGRAAAIGDWTDVAFNAANFTASTGNWTLQSGDQVTFAYMLVGKTLFVAFEFDATDTSAITANLMVAIPGGFTAAKKTRAIIQTIDNGGAAQAGVAFVNATGTQINFQSTVAGGGWANTGGAANNTYVRGQIAIPIQ